MDIEGTMKFILDQQAQFSSDIARINSVLDRVVANQDRLAERQITFERNLERLAERQSEAEQTILERQRKTEQTILEVGQTLLDVANAQERTNKILATLAERQVETEKSIEEARRAADEARRAADEARRATEEAIRGLVERQKTTEENLNVLLLTVERHISNHK